MLNMWTYILLKKTTVATCKHQKAPKNGYDDDDFGFLGARTAKVIVAHNFYIIK